MPTNVTISLAEHAALALRSAARAQIRALRRKRPNAKSGGGLDLNALDIEHLEAFVREVEATYPPLSEDERDLIRDLRQGRLKLKDAYPLALESLAARGKVAWHESEFDPTPNTTWPAPDSAWIALR